MASNDKMRTIDCSRVSNGWIVTTGSAFSRHEDRPTYVFTHRAHMMEWLGKHLWFDDDKPLVAGNDLTLDGPYQP